MISNIIFVLPFFAGLFRVTLAYKFIIINSPIALAVASNLYIFSGLYGLHYSVSNIKPLSNFQHKLHRTFYYGCGLLFTSRGVAHCYNYLNQANQLQFLSTFLIKPAANYSLLIQLIAHNLPIISLSILTMLAIIQLITAKPKPFNGILSKLICFMDVSFLTIATFLCLTHSYITLSHIINHSTYFATVMNPYSMVNASLLLNTLYEPLATAVLIMPRSMPQLNEYKLSQQPNPKGTTAQTPTLL